MTIESANGTDTAQTGASSTDARVLRELLLARRRTGATSVVTRVPGIPHTATDSEPWPLSSGQRRLWFLDSLQDGGTDYLVPLAQRLDGPVDVQALHRAWTGVVERHPVLSTRYRLRGVEPVQELVGAESARFVATSVEAAPVRTRESRAIGLIKELSRERMSLADGHVARMHLVTVSPDQHYLLALFHHICFDAGSEPLFWRDLSRLYQAETDDTRAEGRPEAEQDPVRRPLRYADYAQWQQARLGDQDAQESLRYWERALNALEPVELPLDRPRSAERTMAGTAVPFSVPEHLAADVRRLAREHRTTPFVVLLTAFQTLLARYSGRSDVAVASPVAGRTEPELDDVIGFFVNTVVLRARWSDDPTFADLLTGNQGVLLDALEHQELPFEELVQRLEPDRDLSRTPLVQVMFGYREVEPDQLDLPGIRSEAVDLLGEGAKFDLNLQVESSATAMSGALEYSTDVFDRATADRIVAHFVQLLGSVTGNPGTLVSELDYLSEDETRRLVVTANDTDKPRRWTPVHQLVAEQAGRMPGSPALVSGGQVLDFGQLETRANQLARHLREQGAGPEGIVAIDLPRGVELVVAMLAVLKAGAAYLPLEPADAANRRRNVIADAGVRLMVTDVNHAPDLPKMVDVRLVLVDRHRAQIEAHLPTDPEIPVDPDGLAYVIYTSGTTGRPKGVMVTHRGLVNYLWWSVEAYAGAEGSTALFSSVAFDLVVPNLYTSLMLGRAVHLLPSDFEVFELGTLLLAAGPLSFVKLAPGHLEMLCAQLTSSQRRQLADLVIAAGDRFPEHLANEWLAPGADGAPVQDRLAAEYGPTEITIGNSASFVTEPGTRELVSIGTPIPNTTAYVLDATMRPLPVGVVGEVYIGGVGVARGYLNQPGLTAEKFLPDPFSTTPGARLYRTGDLARVRPCGDFEFVGRIDGQVKIRGYRVEPAEIENDLGAHPQIRAAVVCTRQDRQGKAELVAYVVPAADPRTGEQEILSPTHVRTYLQQRQAEYMVPAAIVILGELPLTTNGKIDVRALPDPDRDAFDSHDPIVVPRDAIETRLASVWSDVLGVTQVGVHDSFFELGGDSIRAVAVVGAVRELGFDVTVRDVFRHRTVAEFATLMNAHNTDLMDAARVRPFEMLSDADRAALPPDAADAYPLSRIQLGMILEMITSGTEGNYHNVTSYLIRDHEPFSTNAFQAAVDLVVSRHEVLRTSMDLSSYSEPLQVVHRDARLPIGYQDVRDLAESVQAATLDTYMTSERARQFDLSLAPLFRFFIHHYENHWRMTFTEFHPILEGWSLHVMLMEILGCYQQIRDGQKPTPADLPDLRYADFISLERREAVDKGHAVYWQAVSAGYPTLQLPKTWGGTDGGFGRTYLKYEKHLGGLRELARRADVPLKSVLHAAHLKVMSMLTGADAFASGLVCDTRPEIAGAEGVLGLYLNTVPFSFDADREAARTWTDLARTVFGTEIDLWPHRRYPLSDIRRAGQARTEVAFAYLDFRMVDSDLINFDEGIDDSPNEFPLMVTCHQGELSLGSRPQEVTEVERHRLGQMYLAVLASMAADPEADCRGPFGPDPQIADGLSKPDLGCTAAPERTPLAPRNRTELRLLTIWERLLEADAIGVDDDFFEVGGHSLLSVRLVATIRKEMGIRIPMSALMRSSTIAEQAALIEADGPRVNASGTESNVIQLRAGEGPPLFCVHPIGGTVFCYLELTRSLPAGPPVHGFQARGLEPGERPLDTVEAMAEDYLAQARRVHHGGLWRLVGWSFGGLVALEMASRLREQGQDVELTLLEASLPPATESTGPDGDRDTVEKAFRSDIDRQRGYADPLREVGRDEQARMLDVFSADLRAFERYRPPTYTGATHVFLAADESPGRARAHWTQVCTGPLRVQELSGNHFDIVKHPAVDIVAEALGCPGAARSGPARSDTPTTQ